MEKVVEKCLELVQKCWKWRCDMGKVFVGTTHNREYYRHYYILLLMAKALSCSFCRNREIFTVLSLLPQCVGLLSGTMRTMIHTSSWPQLNPSLKMLRTPQSILHYCTSGRGLISDSVLSHCLILGRNLYGAIYGEACVQFGTKLLPD